MELIYMRRINRPALSQAWPCFWQAHTPTCKESAHRTTKFIT